MMYPVGLVINSSILLLLCIIFGIAQLGQSSADVTCGPLNQYDYQFLVDLYNSTNGPHWCQSKYNYVPWVFNATSDPCKFSGITCSCYYSTSANLTYISEVSLKNSCLQGTLPSSIGVPIDFRRFGYDFSENLLTGTIPPEFSQAGGLAGVVSQISLDKNNFTGTLPDDFFSYSLKNLFTFTMNYNNVTGTLPSSIQNTSNLITFSINFNRFYGTMPEFGYSSVRAFAISGNSFTGTFPKSMLHNPGLDTLDLTYNKFEMNITDFLCTSPQYPNPANINDMRLCGNRLYSSLCSNFGTFGKRLQKFYMTRNSITGSIPKSISKLTSLGLLTLNINSMTGTLPKLPKRISELQLQQNRFRGPIPNFTSHDAFTTLNLADNGFTGPFPSLPVSSAVPFVTQILNFSNNLLTGTIPDSFYNHYVAVSMLFLSNNKFSGTIPDSITKLSALAGLYLDGNRFKGTFPQSISLLSELQFVYIASNQFTGTVPCFTSPRLNSIWIYENDFEGEFFRCINFTLQTSIQLIDIGTNRIEGTIPDDISKLQQLRAFVSESNCFKNTEIPRAFCSLPNIKLISLDGFRSGDKCRKHTIARTLPFVKGYIDELDYITMPECILSIKSLETLHLSGNDIIGSLPDIGLNSSLVDFAVSNNFLTGSIPECLQLHHFHNQFNVGFNQLSGTLIPNYQVSPAQTTLVLAENRLSGNLPESIAHIDSKHVSVVLDDYQFDQYGDKNSNKITDLDVLGGNIFACPFNVPQKDVSKRSFTCASNTLNFSLAAFYFTLFAIVGIVAVFLFLADITKVASPSMESESKGKKCARSIVNKIKSSIFFFVGEIDRITADMKIWKAKAEDALSLEKLNIGRSDSFSLDRRGDIPEVRCFISCLMFIRVWAGYLLGWLLLIFLPVYLLLAHSGELIVTNAYTYIASITYLHGRSTFGVVCAFILIAVISSIFLVQGNHQLLFRYMSKFSSTKDEFKSTIRLAKQKTIWEKLRDNSLIVCLVVINTVVTIVANYFYVYQLSPNLPRQTLLLYQIAIGLFQMLWEALYISYICTNLPYVVQTIFRLEKEPYISESLIMRLRFHMSIFNSIVAPCIASLVGDKQCFYYVFNKHKPIKSATTFELCIAFDYKPLTNIITGCSQYVSQYTESYFTPAFNYSFGCGTSFLRAYVPVFIYKNFTTAIVLPALTLIRAMYPGFLMVSYDYDILNCIRKPTLQQTMIRQREEEDAREDAELENLPENEEDSESSGSRQSSRDSCASTASNNSFLSGLRGDRRLPSSELKSLALKNLANPAMNDRPKLPFTRRDVMEVYGRDIIVFLMQNMCLLFTFGIANPLLGVIMVISLYISAQLWTLIVGRNLWVSSHLYYNDCLRKSGRLRRLSNNRTVSVERQANTYNPYTMIPTSEESIHVKFLESNLKYCWKGIKSCFKELIVVVAFFWVLLFFDVVNDGAKCSGFGCTAYVVGALLFILILIAASFSMKIFRVSNKSLFEKLSVFILCGRLRIVYPEFTKGESWKALQKENVEFHEIELRGTDGSMRSSSVASDVSDYNLKFAKIADHSKLSNLESIPDVATYMDERQRSVNIDTFSPLTSLQAVAEAVDAAEAANGRSGSNVDMNV